MKKILIPIGALLVSGLAYSQTTGASSGENYIQSRTYLEPVTISSSTARQVETVQYFDGLGRPKQMINVKASPTGKDVVNHIEYDGFGRQAKDFLPVPQQGTQNGAIYTTPLSNATQPTLYGSEKIYAEKQFENSPLDRILQQKQVGTAWNDKPVQIGYDANTTGDAVKKYTIVTTWVDGATSSVLSQSSNYGAAQLYKNTVSDEDGNVTIEFKNGEGQVVLVRKVISDTEKADTYYVYNEYNQLAYVIPPKAAVAADPNTVLVDLCYQYKYDGRSRLVEKKLPGKGWEYMIYDTADRLVMSQDANLRAQNKWLFSKHDKFSRVLYTGIVIDGGARNAIQGHLEAVFGSNTETEGSFQHSGITIYHGKTAAPTSFDKILTVNYYDKYPQYDFNPTFPTDIIGQLTLTDNASTDGRSTKGLAVMSLVKNIEDDNWTKNYIYYDKKGRAVGSYSINHLGGRTKVDSKLDFAGVVQQSVTTHKRLDTDTDRVITENFTYDNQNRLLTHTHQVDSNPMEYLAQNSYNELSQISAKKVGGISPSVPLQDISYSYNIRGWMTKINDPANLNGKLFGYSIKYNQVEGQETPDPFDTGLKVLPRYNGNIAEVDWRTNTVQGDYLRRYGYVYDRLNRLTAGFYQRDDHPSANEYFEKMTYDLNGNIINLKRTASLDGNTTSGLIDNLTYEYFNNNNSNTLMKISDIQQNMSGYPYVVTPASIVYDDNGNMTINADKGFLGINYNYLNLPNYLQFKKALSTRTGRIYENTSYLYRADGIKLRKIYNFAPYNPLGIITQLSSEQTDYIDGFQYKTGPNGLGGPKGGTGSVVTSLQFYPTAEGYYDFVKNKYIYNYVDHLGNVRLSYFNNGSGIELLEENNYYPFGLKHEGYNPLAGNSAYQYKYNGKELQTESGMYDYGARFYMPDIGRWGVVDPLAEKMTRHSPYNYAFNNPIRFIDPDGREGTGWIKSVVDGQTSWTYDKDVHSLQDAKDKKYTNVTEYQDALTITGISNGQQNYQYTLDTSGVATDSSGKVMTESFTTGAGTQIGVNPDSQMLASIGSIQGGTGFYAGFTGSILVGGGITASLGLVQDGNGHVETYFTLGGGLGLGVSGGIEGGAIIPIDPNHTFVTSEFRGTGITYSGGEGLINGSFGGTFSDKYKGFKNADNFDMSHFGVHTPDGYRTKGFGIIKGSAGLPVSWAKTNTWVSGK